MRGIRLANIVGMNKAVCGLKADTAFSSLEIAYT